MLCIRSAVPEQLLISFPAHFSANGEYFRCFVGSFTVNCSRIFFERLTVSIIDIFFPCVRPSGPDIGTGQLGSPPTGAPTYKGRCDATGIIGNVVLVNSGFHKPKNFLQWARTHPLKDCQFFPRPKKFKNRGFKGQKIISLRRAPNY